MTNIEENFIFFCSPTTWPRFALKSDFQYLWQLSRVAKMTATIWNILEMIDIVLSHFDLLHAVEAQNSFWSEFLLRMTQRRSRVQFDLLWQFPIVLCVTVRPSSANSINSWMTRKSRRETSTSHARKRLQVASNDRLKMILVGDWIDWLSRTCFCYCCRRWDLLPSSEGDKSFSFL